MSYFKIYEDDYSHCVSGLKVSTKTNYNAQTNAAGNTVVDKINNKKVVEVKIIPLDEVEAQRLLETLEQFKLSIAFRNPRNGSLTRIECIIPDTDIEYYTIQVDKQMLKEFSLTFTEL